MQKASLPPPSSSDQATHKVLLSFDTSRVFRLFGYPKQFSGKMSTAALTNWRTKYYLTKRYMARASNSCMGLMFHTELHLPENTSTCQCHLLSGLHVKRLDIVCYSPDRLNTVSKSLQKI